LPRSKHCNGTNPDRPIALLYNRNHLPIGSLSNRVWPRGDCESWSTERQLAYHAHSSTNPRYSPGTAPNTCNPR
jgi:hypothetical protein